MSLYGQAACTVVEISPPPFPICMSCVSMLQAEDCFNAMQSLVPSIRYRQIYMSNLCILQIALRQFWNCILEFLHTAFCKLHITKMHTAYCFLQNAYLQITYCILHVCKLHIWMLANYILHIAYRIFEYLHIAYNKRHTANLHVAYCIASISLIFLNLSVWGPWPWFLLYLVSLFLKINLSVWEPGPWILLLYVYLFFKYSKSLCLRTRALDSILYLFLFKNIFF